MNDSLQFLARWRWWAARRGEALGRKGWLGLAAGLLALILAVAVLPGLASRKAALEEMLLSLRSGPQGEQALSIARLSLLLPGPGTAGDFANLLNLLATRTGVRIDRMEYQLQREAGKPVLQYRAELVAIAPYLSLRGWLDAILAERPTVAIDELVFERPNAETDAVVARVRLVLFMKGEG
mgnify:CR=1 FL=1